MKSNHGTTRRDFLRWTAGLAGLGWLDHLTLHAAELRRQQRACILLWMAGGPSQFETFDPKPGADTQGPTRSIPTAVPGIHIAEHWRSEERRVGKEWRARWAAYLSRKKRG